MIKKSFNYLNRKRTVVLLLILCCIFLRNCKKADADGINNPNQNIHQLAGTWDINKMTSVYQGVTNILNNQQLDSLGIIWMYDFRQDYSMELITNISGEEIHMQGTWSIKNDSLTTIMTAPDGSISKLKYAFSIQGILLILKWQIPAGTTFEGEFIKQ